MKNNKNGLDEMQRKQRNSIGNQMFMLMFYAIMIDCGLYGYGVRWLSYPGNVMVIITACMGIYLVRLIAFNAYLPPKAQNRKTIIILIMAIVCSIAFANAVVNMFVQSPAQITESTEDNSALIMMIVSAVGLLATLIVAVIKKANSKEDTDE